MVCIGICGDSASGKSFLANLLSRKIKDALVFETDRYHRWDRYSENWKETTQLDPEANNLELMKQDIEALKSGRSIWQRSYDHSSGKFTSPEEIEPTKHLIVCGLHTLMFPELYDIKIFLDPSSQLKTKWKLKRDVEERGYCSEQVLEQIKKRQNDYVRYIEPQKEKANIIFNESIMLCVKNLLS